MRAFVNDDKGYLDWLVAHQDGFVVNAFARPTADYLMLHRADCHTINGKPARGDSWTRRGYAKICASSIQELTDWARQETGGALQPCGTCHPIRGDQELAFTGSGGDHQPMQTVRRPIVQFAISIPQFVNDGAFDPDTFRGYMQRAEALGFVSAWTQEQLFGRKPALDPLTAMTYAAACTERIRLGCAVFVLPLHSPVHLAKSLSSLDQVSRGRIEVGIGSGGRHRDFAAFGIGSENVGDRFTEAIQVMQACWTGGPISHGGEIWQIDRADMEPKPFQKPYPPLWFGAHKPVALRRAVQFGDGFFGAGSSTTAQFAREVIALREILAQADRDPASFPIAKRVYIGVDDDGERVRQRVATALEELYGAHGRANGIAAVAVAGTPDECVQGLQEVAAAGAETIMLNPLFDDLAQMERLTAEVIPALA
jgi:probable F420-dependent oxidoreductase